MMNQYHTMRIMIYGLIGILSPLWALLLNETPFFVRLSKGYSKYKLVNFHKTRPGHDKHYGLDDSKIRALGWKSPVSFEDSLRNTVEWQQKNQKWINIE